MKNINMKIILLLCMISIITIFIPSGVEAAGGFSISRSSASLNPGGTTTITISASNCAGQFTISSSNSSVATVSTSSMWLDNSSSTVTVTAKGAGTATISITASDVTDTDLNTVSGTKSCAITVPNPEPVTPPPATGGNNSGGGTTTNKPTTNNNSGTTTNKPSTNNNSKPETPKPEEKKSNDSSLKGLIVEGFDLYPEFNTSTKEYNVKVTNDITTIKIVPTVNHEKATVKIEGLPEELQVGANVVRVIVTAEDGSTNTYIITVNRPRENLKLQSLNVSYIDENGIAKQLPLNPEITEGVYEYTLEQISYLVSNLNVDVKANLEQAKIEITGNDELVEGENTIVITITMPSESEEEEDEVLTYKITVTKEKEPVVTPMGSVKNWFNGITGTISNWYAQNQYKVVMGALMLCSAAMGGLSVYLVIEYKKYRLLVQKIAEITKMNSIEKPVTENIANIQPEQTILQENDQAVEDKIKPRGRHF